MDWVLGGQCYTASTDYDHNEEIEVAQIHHEMTKTAQPDKKPHQTQQRRQTIVVINVYKRFSLIFFKTRVFNVFFVFQHFYFKKTVSVKITVI